VSSAVRYAANAGVMGCNYCVIVATIEINVGDLTLQPTHVFTHLICDEARRRRPI